MRDFNWPGLSDGVQLRVGSIWRSLCLLHQYIIATAATQCVPLCYCSYTMCTIVLLQLHNMYHCATVHNVYHCATVATQ